MSPHYLIDRTTGKSRPPFQNFVVRQIEKNQFDPRRSAPRTKKVPKLYHKTFYAPPRDTRSLNFLWHQTFLHKNVFFDPINKKNDKEEE